MNKCAKYSVVTGSLQLTSIIYCLKIIYIFFKIKLYLSFYSVFACKLRLCCNNLDSAVSLTSYV